MRQEVYRVAYDEAYSELNEIIARFEQLRLRKDRVEKLVEALKPLVIGNDPYATDRAYAAKERQTVVGERSVSFTAGEPVAVAAGSISYPPQQTVEPSNDPFARRDNSATFGARDVKEYSRLFNATVAHGG